MVYARGGLSWQKGTSFPLVTVSNVAKGTRAQLVPPTPGNCFDNPEGAKDTVVCLALTGPTEVMILELETPAECQMWEDGLSLIVEASVVALLVICFWLGFAKSEGRRSRELKSLTDICDLF